MTTSVLVGEGTDAPPSVEEKDNLMRRSKRKLRTDGDHEFTQTARRQRRLRRWWKLHPLRGPSKRSRLCMTLTRRN
ncbi:uncharacterized protein DS421_5g163590 [Arachis hypogaea]|nr:uncharacterized protein DS421_5g163590 [Arachis hypogaea]